MKTSILSALFGGTLSVLILLGAGASFATDGLTVFSVLHLALGSLMFVSTILFWGDAKRHEARMAGLEIMLEFTDGLRKSLEEHTKEKPPKAGKKK